MLKLLKKFVPKEYHTSVLEIDFERLYQLNYKLILIDLDNTLVSYDVLDPTDEIYDFVKRIQDMGFEIIICSNNKNTRVARFCKNLKIKYLSTCMKPLLFKVKKACKLASRKYHKNEIIFIGDQVMTDVFCGNRLGFYTILIKAIKRKTEVFTTRFNRKLERRIVNRIKKKDYNLYSISLKQYEEENYAK